MRALDGITVIALEHAVAGPFCTRQLADHGARVIKIERPGVGDFARAYDGRVRGQSSYFVWANRSKQSLALDLKHASARGILLQLLESADVLVQNLAPGAAARLGLGFPELQTRFPRLIVCDITGYGSGGPQDEKKSYDLLIQSEAGLLSITGTEAEPAKAGCSIADISAGMYAYSCILAALIQRGRTGRGAHVEISMLECMVEWLGHALYYAFDGASPPPRSGAAHATIYPYGPFRAGDGETVMLAVQNEREWGAFCEGVLRLPALATDPRFASNALRSAARLELQLIINEIFAGLTEAQVIARLDGAHVAHARVNTIDAIWTHPQLMARRRWTEVATPAGAVPALLPPGLAAEYASQMGPVPALGEHTRALLREIGLDDLAIERLRAEQVI